MFVKLLWKLFLSLLCVQIITRLDQIPFTVCTNNLDYCIENYMLITKQTIYFFITSISLAFSNMIEFINFIIFVAKYTGQFIKQKSVSTKVKEFNSNNNNETSYYTQ